jgi:hypothetical protein
MSRHRYDRRALAADYVRAGLGLALTVAPVILVEPAPVVGVSLSLLGALCAAFALRTLAQQLTEIAVDAEGIRIKGPWPRAIPWRDLGDVSLAYFATRRDRSKGWMELRVSGAGQRIKADSTIGDFTSLAAASLAAANAKGLPVSARTAANAAELGIGGHHRAAA